MSEHTLDTTMLVSVALTEEEFEVAVTYSVTPGCAETRDDPGSDATAEVSAISIGGVEQPWLTKVFAENETLLAECLADWIDRCEIDRSAAEEYRAEQRRDDRMMERA